MVIVVRAEQAIGLADQLPVRGDLLRRHLQLVRPVGDHVQPHRRGPARIQVHLLVIATGDQRAVHKGLEGGLAELDGSVALALGVEGGGVFPALRQADRGLHRNVPGEPAGGIERQRVPLRVQHFRRHHHPALPRGHRRQELEADLQRPGAGGRGHVEGEHVHRVAGPFQRLAVGGDLEPRQLVDGAGGGVVAGQPAGIGQHHRARPRQGHDLAHGKDPVRQVRGVHGHFEGGGVGRVAGLGDGLGQGRRHRRNDCGAGGACDEQAREERGGRRPRQELMQLWIPRVSDCMAGLKHRLASHIQPG